ncbi:MAG: hypothetical protein HRU15_03650 [Planctomycetes bacterium]|nr:hypothetical protein [Planctomycetota bacterium]
MDNSFPDNETCSLACGVGWDTYVNGSGSYNEDGWYASEGDIVSWVIRDDEDLTTYRFDGLHIIGNGIVDIEMTLNGDPLNGHIVKRMNACRYRIDVDEYVGNGDVIGVHISKTAGDGYVNSIQPSGVH